MMKPVTITPIATCAPVLKPSLLIDSDFTSLGVVDCDDVEVLVVLVVAAVDDFVDAGFDVVAADDGVVVDGSGAGDIFDCVFDVVDNVADDDPIDDTDAAATEDDVLFAGVAGDVVADAAIVDDIDVGIAVVDDDISVAVVGADNAAADELDAFAGVVDTFVTGVGFVLFVEGIGGNFVVDDVRPAGIVCDVVVGFACTDADADSDVAVDVVGDVLEVVFVVVFVEFAFDVGVFADDGNDVVGTEVADCFV